MKCTVFVLALVCCVWCGPLEDDALQEFVKGHRKFSGDVYRELAKSERGNIITSPLSAQTVLALTNEGAKGETSREFVASLSLPSSSEKIRKAFKSILPKFQKSDDGLKLAIANKIYLARKFALEDSFKSIATDVYNSEVENVDFNEKNRAVQTINGWVEDHTNQKIRNLISPDMINEYTRLILINALYFNGKWVSEFKKSNTEKRKFYKSKDVTVDLETMSQFSRLKYYENSGLNAKFLELEYKGGDVSMVIVLPNDIEGLSRLEENIEEVLKPQPFTYELVDVHLPKFTIETTVKLPPILKKLGMRKVFGETSDLSGISSSEQLYVSDVIQKAFINVTETGTEAAAATAVLMSVPDSVEIPERSYGFYADRPFLYYIQVTSTETSTKRNGGTVLCVGRVTE